MHLELIPRLIDEAEYFTFINSIYNNIYIGKAGQQYAYSIGVCFTDGLKKFHTGYLRHALIGNKDVYRILFEQFSPFSSRSSGEYIVIASETGFESSKIPALIINVQYFDP